MIEQRASWAAHAHPSGSAVITGTVTGIDGQPVAGACVTAVGAGRSVTSAAARDGSFRLAGLTAGSYTLEYRDCATAGRYLTTWSGGASAQNAAARVRVAAGQVHRVPAVTLRPVNALAAIAARQAAFRRLLAAGSHRLSAAAAALTGEISGKVTGKGKPLGAICVEVIAVSGAQSYGARTAKNGTYAVRGVAPGRYYVIFDPTYACPSRSNWLQQAYKNDNNPFAPAEGRATAVRVQAGRRVSGISGNLELGGEISGTVTSKSGTRLRGICVSAAANEGHGQFVSGSGQTAANGRYTLHALFPGKYKLYFQIGCGSRGENYAPATHAGISISLGQNRTVNQVLPAGASISGIVTLTTTSGQPLSGICVFASNASGSVSGFTSTSSNGSYRVIGLTGGLFYVQFAPGCNNTGNYTSASLTVRTTAGRQASLNAVLQVGATISGTITDTANNLVPGMCIEVVSNNNNSNFNVQGDVDGTYLVNQLSAGTYQVGFYSGCGNSGNYAPNWYDNQPSEGTATPITVATAADDSTVNAVLQPGATISGTVTNTAGNAVFGECVFATTPSGSVAGSVSVAQTNRHGGYTISDLAPGQYLIEFGCEQRYGDQWFPGAPDEATAELVSASAGQTSGINAVLQASGRISGAVTGTGGHPLAGVCVFAVNTKGTPPALRGGGIFITTADVSEVGITSAHGTYKISGLAAGRYQVSFRPCFGGTRYAEQWYRGKVSARTATVVTVRAGKTTSGISARLVIGGSISGRVTAAGKPLRNVCVVAAAAAGGPVGGGVTGKAGTYRIPALASGRYTVEFAPCGSQNLIPVVTHVRVAAPHARTGINATMNPGGSIAGTVTASSGQPVSTGCVEAYTTNGTEPAGFGYTGFDGSYQVTGLAAGSYQVYFGDPECLFGVSGLAPQWYDNQATRGAATAVPVTVGATTPSIDAVLQPEGEVTGTVSGPSATPVSGACVTAFPVLSGTQSASGSMPVVAVSSAGSYTLADLLPGQYKVQFSAGCGATGYLTQWWQDAATQTAATVITVGAGQTVPGISATLSKS